MFQSGKPGMKDSPKTTSSAPAALAVAAHFSSLPIEASRFRNTGAACTGAARKRPSTSPAISALPVWSTLRVRKPTPSPLFRERSNDVIEGPRRRMLVSDVKYFVRNRVRLGKVVSARPVPGGGWLEPLRPSAPSFFQPRRIDCGIDGYVSNVHVLWPKVARQRLGQNALRRLGRRKERVVGNTSERGGIAGHDYRAAAGSHHVGGEGSCQMQERRGVHAEVSLQGCRICLEKR